MILTRRLRRRLEALGRAFLALTTFLLLVVTIVHRDDADGFQAAHLFFMPRATWEMDRGEGMLYEPDYYERADLEVLAAEVYGEGNYEARPISEREIDAPPVESAATRTHAYQEWLSSQEQAYTDWFERTHGAYDRWLDEGALTFASWLDLQPPPYRTHYEAELASIAMPGTPGADQPNGTAGFVDAAVDSESEGDGEAQNTLSPGKGKWSGATVRRLPHSPAGGSNTIPLAATSPAPELPAWQAEQAIVPASAPPGWRDRVPTPPPRG